MKGDRLSAELLRALRRACALAIALTIAGAAGASAWKVLDRRPAWVMAVNVSARGASRDAVLREERAVFAAVLRRIENAGFDAPEQLREAESMGDTGIIFIETRTAIVRDEDDRRLLRLYRSLYGASGITPSDPVRAVRPADVAFPLLLIALLVGMATLEPFPRFDRAAPAATRPGLAIITGFALGLLAAAAVLAGPGWPPLFQAAAVVVASIPVVLWFVRARAVWDRNVALRGPYRAFAATAALVAAGWTIAIIAGAQRSS
ncbi:MAG TPA: hypothetical protein VFF00_06795 [Candidatus Elarobacter sp.]|nr:hypothetical protein [Dongiaceae bacterium]HZW53723.1 hypothetical protein [Candidatus Elarobacter sp.]